MASVYAFIVALIYVFVFVLFVRFLYLGVRYFERELDMKSWFSGLDAIKKPSSNKPAPKEAKK